MQHPVVVTAIGIAGALLVIVALWDAFQTLLVPRRIGRRYRFTSLFYAVTWRVWREWARGAGRRSRREAALAQYAPFSILLLLACWAAALIVGFAMVQLAAGSLPTHGPGRFATLIYMSAETFFTLGYGDFTPTTTLGRWAAALESGTGFAFLGTVIGYMPTMYGAFSQRELLITLFDAQAGSPPTAGGILARTPAVGRAAWLEARLVEWERWCGQLLENTISFPLIAYYRSQHSDHSWLGALLAILDTSAIVLAGAGQLGAHQAQFTFAMARHALVDIAQLFVERPPERLAERLAEPELARLLDQLGRAGIAVDDSAAFAARLAALRREYEPYAQALAEHLLITLPPFVPEGPVRDHWEAAPWDRALGTRPVAAVWEEEHF